LRCACATGTSSLRAKASIWESGWNCQSTLH